MLIMGLTLTPQMLSQTVDHAGGVMHNLLLSLLQQDACLLQDMPNLSRKAWHSMQQNAFFVKAYRPVATC